MLDRIPPARGYSLTELLVVLGLAAILAASAAPAFTGFLLDSRRDAALTTATHAVNLARQFAALRGESMRLCGSLDQRRCSGSTQWSEGFLIANENDGLQSSLAMAGSPSPPAVRSNRDTILFEAGSGDATPATITICDRRGSAAARAVIISRSGRPRVSARDASDRPLAC